MNWYKKSQVIFPRWFKQEIATEMENINVAIGNANSDVNKEFEGVGLEDLEKAKNLLSEDPIEYFRSETFRHNYMCIQLQIRNVEGYKDHCDVAKIYGNIYRKIINWQSRHK